MIPTMVADALGYQLDETSYGSVLDLNAFAPSLVEDARRLLKHQRLYAFTFLRHFVPRAAYGDIDDFIDEVVAGGHSASTWRRGDHFCSLIADFPPLLAETAEQVEARLTAIEGAEPLSCRSSDDTPGVVVRDRTYRWRAPPGIDSTELRSDEILKPIDDFRSAYRRWLASQFAQYWFELRHQRSLPADSDLGLPLSADAVAALGILRRA